MFTCVPVYLSTITIHQLPKESMTDIILAGLGQTDVGERWDIGLRGLAFTAIEAALKDQTP